MTDSNCGFFSKGLCRHKPRFLGMIYRKCNSETCDLNETTEDKTWKQKFKEETEKAQQRADREKLEREREEKERNEYLEQCKVVNDFAQIGDIIEYLGLKTTMMGPIDIGGNPYHVYPYTVGAHIRYLDSNKHIVQHTIYPKEFCFCKVIKKGENVDHPKRSNAEMIMEYALDLMRLKPSLTPEEAVALAKKMFHTASGNMQESAGLLTEGN